nr:hypothetical protein [Tanacetum cinerariifolium]
MYVLTTPMPKLLEDDTVETIRRRAKWKNDDYICIGHISNGMFDPIFDNYQNVKSAKDLWDSLESKQVAFFLEGIQTYFEGKDDMSLVQFGSHLHILRVQESDKGKEKKVVGPSVNTTKKGRKNKNNKKGKKRGFKDNNGSSGSNKKPRLECWKCGKTGHFKRDCRSGNNKNNASVDCSGKGTYKPVDDESVLYMGDDHFAHVHEKEVWC